MVEVKIGKGSNATVTLTVEQENRAIALANSALEKKSTLPFSRASTDAPKSVRDRASYLFSTQQAKSFITAKESFERARGIEVEREVERLRAEGVEANLIKDTRGVVVGIEAGDQSIPLSSLQREGGVTIQGSTAQVEQEPTGFDFRAAAERQEAQEQFDRQGKVEAVVRDDSFSGLFGLPSFFSRQEAVLSTKQARGGGGIVTGAGLTAIGFAKPFVYTAQSIINPVETTKSIFTSLKTPVSTFKDIKLSMVTSAGTNPSGFIGGVLGTVSIFKVPKLVTKGVDKIRVRGLTELPAESVLAPEFFKGQTYPAISRGQSAGQLLSEFKPVETFGVTRLRGFTASPKPFKADTIAGIGSSELAGVYQAPKVSPQFLRVVGEQKVFSFKVFDTLRPTVTKIEPLSFELTSLVTPSQRNLASVYKSKSFFKTAPKGKSFIPFVKTEKEAVIPFGTTLTKTGRRFQFKFEGRSIPIDEFKTVKTLGTTKGLTTPKTIKIKSVYSSSGKIGSAGRFNPYSVGVSLSKLRSSSKGLSSRGFSLSPSLSSSRSSSSSSKLSSSLTPSVSSYKSLSSSKLSSSFTPSYSGSSFGSSFSGSGSSSGSGSGGGRGFGGGGGGNIQTPSIKGLKLPKQSFTVSIRRQGIFKPIASGVSLSKAFNIGTSRTGKTLAATFKITGGDIGFKTPKGFRRKQTRKGTLFIESPKLRLSTGSEVKQIQLAKMKGGLF